MRDVWREPYHVVIEVENKKCKMVKKLASLGFKHLKVADVRSSSSGSVKHLMELGKEQAERVPVELAKLRGKPQGSSMWFESEGCEVCNTILAYDAFLVSGKSLEDPIIMYSFMVPTFNAYKGIIEDLEKTGHTVNVVKLGKFEPKPGVLTVKQERLFWLALKGGFFDYPRKIDSAELAAKLGISPATFSETLRRGSRRLLEHYFKSQS
jgi:predicted DNA binding protein